MRTFCTYEDIHHWHYLNAKNIKLYLNKSPYHQKGKYYAVCTYCHCPMLVIARKDPSGKASFYAKHLTKPKYGFPHFDIEKINYCLLIKRNPLFVFNPLSQSNDLDIKELNINELRKALTSYLGIYVTNSFTKNLVQKYGYVSSYDGVDKYNLPFALLTAIKKPILLNGRKVASAKLRTIINQQPVFIISDSYQIQETDDFQKTKLILRISKQFLSNAGLPALKITILTEAKSKTGYVELYSFNIFAKMFNSIFLEKGKEVF